MKRKIWFAVIGVAILFAYAGPSVRCYDLGNGQLICGITKPL